MGVWATFKRMWTTYFTRVEQASTQVHASRGSEIYSFTLNFYSFSFRYFCCVSTMHLCTLVNDICERSQITFNNVDMCTVLPYSMHRRILHVGIFPVQVYTLVHSRHGQISRASAHGTTAKTPCCSAHWHILATDGNYEPTLVGCLLLLWPPLIVCQRSWHSRNNCTPANIVQQHLLHAGV